MSKKKRIAELLKKYKHAWVFSYILLYVPWFLYLESQVTENYYVIHSWIDEKIPFVEYFIAETSRDQRGVLCSGRADHPGDDVFETTFDLRCDRRVCAGICIVSGCICNGTQESSGAGTAEEEYCIQQIKREMKKDTEV